MPRSGSTAAAGSSGRRSPSPSSSSGGLTSRALSAAQQKKQMDSATLNAKIRESELNTLKADLKNARRNTTMLRAPITTTVIFAQVLFDWARSSLRFLFSHKALSYSLAAAAISTLALVLIAGPESEYVLAGRHSAWFVVWWVGLGILSSVGLGTGLHTFVLYLGPYIAKVTLAVTECDTMNVPLEGAFALVCPPVGTPKEAVTFMRILIKVLPACFLWGAGTAIGELPPYFVSRAARLSGQKLEELDELEEEDRGERIPSRLDRIKLILFHALQRWGFWAIVICASVPNPLFDLAGITCGHFLIPFWTFFGATFIGKAMVKVQIQSCGVILAFSKDRLAWIIAHVESIVPEIFAGKLGPMFEKQRQQFHGAAVQKEEGGSMIAFLWNWLLIVMLLWFLKSIVESSVQERMADRDTRRIDEWLAAHEEKQGVTTRRMEDRIHEQHPNLPSVLSTAAAAASAADEALAIESSGSLMGKVPRETPRDKAAKTGSNKKKAAVAGAAGSNKKNSH